MSKCLGFWSKYVKIRLFEYCFDFQGKCKGNIIWHHLFSSLQILAVDAEGLNLNREKMMTLMQIGTTSGRAFLFDIQANEALVLQGGLHQLLTANEIVKVSCLQ